jgi:diguanylate cyclase (GGDEF)-like protein
MLDLDDFKAINETHGHPFGDGVLQGVGAAIRSKIRSGDTAARTGGEEFALILPGTEEATAEEIADRVRSAITHLSPAASKLSCSAGIAVYPVDTADAATLLQLAEGALYWAKRSGKARTRRFDPDHVRLSGDAAALEIQRILKEGAIEPVYQPVASLTTGRLVGYEALARFPDSPGRPRRPGSRRRTPADSGPSSRRRRSGRRWTRSGAPPAPTSRST